MKWQNEYVWMIDDDKTDSAFQLRKKTARTKKTGTVRE
jgi:hypothetical protein